MKVNSCHEGSFLSLSLIFLEIWKEIPVPGGYFSVLIFYSLSWFLSGLIGWTLNEFRMMVWKGNKKLWSTCLLFEIYYVLSSIPFSLQRLVFWHQEVASDSFCLLINSPWLSVFILIFFFLSFSGFNLYCWKGIHFS
jgi:hypothetical protein